MTCTRIGLIGFLSIASAFPIPDPTPTPTPPAPELVLIGRLVRIGHGAGCGYFSMGVVAEYADLQILKGTYKEGRAFVVHGCPELTRPEFSQTAGSLKSFDIGGRHRLELLSDNFYDLELVYGQELKPGRMPLFYALRADPADTASGPPASHTRGTLPSGGPSDDQCGSRLNRRCSGPHPGVR